MIRTTRTENGIVRGIEAADPRITAFKGIPFAAPPVGDNRWRAPQPAENWSGIRECYRFAPISVQDTPGIGDVIYNREWHVDPEIEMNEDCLYLNIWTNAKDTNEKKPVLIWFFGGGLQWGYTAEMEFDGERIARRGIVVVAVNYRLNIFGFLAHPELSAEQPETPANFGHLDQQAGIDWVIRNIANFGGDPENITIAGQSAGGGSVLSQMACPGNTGKFQRAIICSAMIRSPYGEAGIGEPVPLKSAEEKGVDFFNYIGVKSLAEARKLPALFLRDKYSEYYKEHGLFFNVLDGHFCVGDPIKLFYENRRNIVPVMSGNTADEFPNFIAAETEEDFRAKAKELFGDRAEEFFTFKEALNKTEDNHYSSVSGIECTIKSVFGKCSETEGNPSNYYYRFDTTIPGDDNPGNFHSVDLWFFFETLAKCWRPFDGRYYDLARQMCDYWVNFIKSGDPNGLDANGQQLPLWKPYTREEQNSIVFNEDGIYTEEKDAGFIGFLSREMDRILQK